MPPGRKEDGAEHQSDNEWEELDCACVAECHWVSSYEVVQAGVAELADALDLGSSGETRAGSIPVARIVRRYS